MVNYHICHSLNLPTIQVESQITKQVVTLFYVLHLFVKYKYINLLIVNDDQQQLLCFILSLFHMARYNTH